MSHEKQQMLRAVAPHLFEQITTELELYNIHLNDIQANVVKKDEGLHVIVLFGENFTQSKSHFFSSAKDDVNEIEMKQFAHKIAEACREIMVADYFKMMKM